MLRDVKDAALAMERSDALKVLFAADCYLTKRVQQHAIVVHRILRLEEPRSEEISRYKRILCTTPNINDDSVQGLILSAATQPAIDSILLLVRSKPAPKGKLAEDNLGRSANFIKNLMLRDLKRIKDTRVLQEYKILARCIVRKIVLYSNEVSAANPPSQRLISMIPNLSRHLVTEVELAVEAGFCYPGYNLTKKSIFEIQEQLDMLRKNKNEHIKRKAKQILNAALRRLDLKYIPDVIIESEVLIKNSF
jgi:hypothetical protein